jgi:uridine kinase
VGLFVGICGGSGSGKSTLTDHLARRLGAVATQLSFDSYYRDLAHLAPDERATQNFDHPDALDHEMLAHHLDELLAGREVAVPGYDFATHTRSADVTIVEPREVVLVEGILLFAFPAIVERLHLRVFRDCPEPVRFDRRRRRDVDERGRTPESVHEQFHRSVKPMHDRFVEPARALAHRVVVHGESLDAVTVELASRIRRATTPAPA